CLFGISLPAFEIAGGVILLLIGLDMLEAKRSPTQETRKDAQAAAAKDDAGIVPMGIPMLAGPGSIATVMVLVGQVQSTWEMAAILGAIAITALSCFLVLGSADREEAGQSSDGDGAENGGHLPGGLNLADEDHDGGDAAWAGEHGDAHRDDAGVVLGCGSLGIFAGLLRG